MSPQEPVTRGQREAGRSGPGSRTPLHVRKPQGRPLHLTQTTASLWRLVLMWGKERGQQVKFTRGGGGWTPQRAADSRCKGEHLSAGTCEGCGSTITQQECGVQLGLGDPMLAANSMTVSGVSAQVCLCLLTSLRWASPGPETVSGGPRLAFPARPLTGTVDLPVSLGEPGGLVGGL